MVHGLETIVSMNAKKPEKTTGQTFEQALGAMRRAIR